MFVTKKQYNKLASKLEIEIQERKHYKNKCIDLQNKLEEIITISQEGLKKNIITMLPPTEKYLNKDNVKIYIKGYNYNESSDNISELTINYVVVDEENIWKFMDGREL